MILICGGEEVTSYFLATHASAKEASPVDFALGVGLALEHAGIERVDVLPIVTAHIDAEISELAVPGDHKLLTDRARGKPALDLAHPVINLTGLRLADEDVVIKAHHEVREPRVIGLRLDFGLRLCREIRNGGLRRGRLHLRQPLAR